MQATPDLMPADILGTTILQAAGAQMIFRPGPVFTDFLLVDEINRMPPRTQSALLECMEERQVTADTERRPLPEVFTVFATQNPIDFEGTYPLPEAQLDRFLMKIRVGYPTVEQERLVLERHHAGFDPAGHTELIPVPAGVLAAAQAEQRLVRIEPELYEYLLGITRRTREWPSLTLGASPRAAISLMRVAQSYAALDGRDFIIPDDVKQAALPVLRHRVMLRPEAELEGLDADRVLTDVIAAVPVPRQTDPAAANRHSGRDEPVHRAARYSARHGRAAPPSRLGAHAARSLPDACRMSLPGAGVLPRAVHLRNGGLGPVRAACSHCGWSTAAGAASHRCGTGVARCALARPRSRSGTHGHATWPKPALLHAAR